MQIEKREKQVPCRFILSGFSQDQGSRRFAFEKIDANHVRTEFTVHADLTLTRIYGIRMQELPLLCRGLLERRPDSEAGHRLTFTEEDMRLHRDDRAAAAGQKKRDRKSTRLNSQSR